MCIGSHEIIDFISDSCDLCTTLPLANNHHLDGCFFDFAEVNGYDALSFSISDTENDGIHEFFGC